MRLGNLKSLLSFLLLAASLGCASHATAVDTLQIAPSVSAAADMEHPADASPHATPPLRSWAELRGWLWADSKTMLATLLLACCMAIPFA